MTSSPLSGSWTHNPGCACSKTSVGCSLQTVGTLWPESLRDWPVSGTWGATGFSPQPPLVPPTGGNGYSSPPGLPTPTTRDHKGHNQRRDATCLTGALLPTPQATNNENRQSEGYGPNRGVALSLLPTLRATA